MRFVVSFASVAVVALILLSGCSSSGPTAALYSTGGAPYGRFACDGGGTMNVRRASGTAIAVTSPNGEEIVLPASPPGQQTRYGADAYALVIEGPDALFMKTGDMPLNCKR